MKQLLKQPGRLLGLLFLGMSSALTVQQAQAEHDIRGISQGANGVFNLYAYPFNMNLPEGTSLYMWGFGDLDLGEGASHQAGANYQLPQYPAPTLIVTEGEAVTINLVNYGVPDNISIEVTGHEMSSECIDIPTPAGMTQPAANPANCQAGLFTQEADVGDAVRYTFTAGSPGTYIYHSLAGANPGLHTEMGLVGVMVVRPADYDPINNRTAYGAGTETDYDHENLYLMTEVDPDIHIQMEKGHKNHFTNTDRYAKVWFINGRVFPDLFQGDFNTLFPNQPYEALVMSRPGDVVLVRNVNAGQDAHPMHYHGENLRFIGRDGKMLSSDGTTADLGRSDNTINSQPKQTVDALWTWTGKDLGWDIYGHDAGHNCIDVSPRDGYADANSDYPGEWCNDHGKPIPVSLPGVGDLTLGGWWSGSPFLGDTGDLPPGEGGLNPFGGYFLVWHSHAEKELTTFDIFPGGSLGSVVVLPPGTPIE
ncbi:MAG: multicopper oxidase domain-containing protein [Candidatus Thiodiazotropha sp. (ex. Lucinisca nassula)]|nr:multicopper oxidase domain-containing protein [Candidatus Thiodiazotropha sp. (ex. Lucinisca nassula)]